jgi:hypothetical protein
MGCYAMFDTTSHACRVPLNKRLNLSDNSGGRSSFMNGSDAISGMANCKLRTTP